MWFVFPQLAGLGRSATSRHFAITGRAEAQAYLGHPLLGPRLQDCVAILQDLGAGDPVAVLGPVDAQKLQSSLTLFAAVAADPAPFVDALDLLFGGRPDERTQSLLAVSSR